jgi:hypothetical protein
MVASLDEFGAPALQSDAVLQSPLTALFQLSGVPGGGGGACGASSPALSSAISGPDDNIALPSVLAACFSRCGFLALKSEPMMQNPGG